MELSDFEVYNAAFELRFATAFALWDKAGAISSRLRQSYPSASIRDARPATVSLLLNETVEFRVELEKLVVVQYRPNRAFQDYRESVQAIVSAVLPLLEVDQYTRVGFRAIYHQTHTDLAGATHAMIEVGLVRVPATRVFSQDAPPHSAEYMLRWEGPATGVSVRAKTETLHVEIKPSPEFRDAEISPLKKELHRLVYDIDYFTTNAVNREQLRVSDWIAHAVHQIHRDSRSFLSPQ